MSSPAAAGPRHRTPALWGLALAILFIVYETTIPFRFHFDRDALAAGWERALLVPFRLEDGDWSSRADVVVNVLLFVPLGFFLGLAAPAGRGGRRPWLLVGAGFLLSLIVESLQLFTPLRYPQTSDLITNTTGTAVGVLAARRGGGRLYDRGCDWVLATLRRDPATLILAALTAAILGGALLPLDFNISLSALGRKLAAVSWDPARPPAPGRLLAALGLVKQGWLFAFWGAAAAFGPAGARRSLPSILGWAALLALVAEGAHLLLYSRDVWILEPVVAWCGAGLGAALTLWGRQIGLGTRRLAWLAAAGYAVFLVADCVSPLAASLVRRILDGPLADPGALKGAWMPWWPEGRLPALSAMGEMTARLVRFVPLALAARLVPWRRGARLATVVAAAVLVLALEWLVWRFSAWSGNMSEVLLAWAGLVTGWYAGGRLDALRHEAAPGRAPGPGPAPARAPAREEPER